MDQKELREWESRCIQEEPPACTAGCPLGVDARAFVQAMVQGDMQTARRILEKTMPLIGITARICEAPCENFCLRKDLGGSIAVGLLERSCISSAPRQGKILCLPSRGKKTGVLGGGPSSLVAAFDLAKKGYAVTLISSTSPGGWLSDMPSTVIPPEILAEELAVLEKMGVWFESATTLTPDVLAEVRTRCQTVYIGHDGELDTELCNLLANVAPETMALPEEGLFTGGIADAEHLWRYITSVAQGRAAALSMDRHMQGVSLTAARPRPRHGHTDLFTSLKDVNPKARIIPSTENDNYSPDEARQEAERCINCQCLECVRHCVYLQEFGSYPKVYSRRVYNNEAIVKGTHQTNTFINSCSLCGQCEILCPHDFSMATLCLEARQRMVEENRMPPSAHAFALDEMRAALSSQFELVRMAPGHQSSSAIFFPGCQLAAVRPDQTIALYHHLRAQWRDTGIWIGCCGAPAHWAGRKTEFREIGEQFLQSWRKLGSPRVLTCCSSCLQMFRKQLPEVDAQSVWSITAPPLNAAAPAKQLPLALTDPCTARNDKATQAAVRRLIADLGQELADLPLSGELTECCGYGGLMDNANPELTRKVLENRVSQTSADFLTYCIMCREQLARTGRPVLHILDLLFPETARSAEEAPLGISTRRANRRALKIRLQEEYFGERISPPEEWQGISLKIASELLPILEKRRILTDDIRQVLWLTEQSGRYFEHQSRGIRLTSARLGEVFFWLEYVLNGNEYLLQKAWSHRMVPAKVTK